MKDQKDIGWQAMQELLDREMPQRDNRKGLWWFLSVIGLLCALGLFLWSRQKADPGVYEAPLTEAATQNEHNNYQNGNVGNLTSDDQKETINITASESAKSQRYTLPGNNEQKNKSIAQNNVNAVGPDYEAERNTISRAYAVNNAVEKINNINKANVSSTQKENTENNAESNLAEKEIAQFPLENKLPLENNNLPARIKMSELPFLPLAQIAPAADEIIMIGNTLSLAPVKTFSRNKMELYAGMGGFANLRGSYGGVMFIPELRLPLTKSWTASVEPFIKLRRTTFSQLVEDAKEVDSLLFTDTSPIVNNQGAPLISDIKTNAYTWDLGINLGVNYQILQRLMIFGGLQYRYNNITGRQGITSYQYQVPNSTFQDKVNITGRAKSYHTLSIGTGLGMQLSRRWQVNTRLWYQPGTKYAGRGLEAGVNIGYSIY